MTSNTTDQKENARLLYFQGWRISTISAQLGIPAATVYSWKNRDKWEKATIIERISDTLENEICRLIVLPSPTLNDEKRLDRHFNRLEKLAKIKKYQANGQARELNPALSDRGRKTNAEKNHIDDESLEKLQNYFRDTFLKWDYQKTWHKAKLKYSVRNILKSRQIGATFYFAHEALLDAAETGDNQIFLSASKMQAHIFRRYIVQTVFNVCGIELKGEHITLSNGAILQFLSTSKSTAQGFNGHLYLDEYFWIHGFKEFQRVTSGMALHSKWRETYFSTPSSITHEAFSFWTGEHFNTGRPRPEHISCDIDHETLKSGKLGDDDQWRHMVTIKDAKAGGCDLFPSIESLEKKYPPAAFSNLLMCEFIDDTASAFSFNEARAGMVDSWVNWADDFTPLSPRPFSNRPVWCGYDPSRSGDNAAFCVIAPPLQTGGKFRLLEMHQWHNLPFEKQAEKIRGIYKKYNFEYLGIDTSGIGYGVYEIIKKFMPNATPIVYSVPVKNAMVLKAQSIFRNRRFEYDAAHKEIPLSFASIRKTTSGKQIIYDAGRTSETGHADIAWSIMHVFNNHDITDGFTDNETDRLSKTIIDVNA